MPRRSGAITMLLLLMAATLFPGTHTAVAIDITCPPVPMAAAAATPQPSPLPETAFPEGDIEVTVFAAASLTDAYAEISDAIERRHPNVTVRVETAGSQTLVTQLSEGAGADILATADTISMRRAQEASLIAGEPAIFAANRLVIVTPPDNPAGIDGIEDLATDDVRLVIAAEEVPAGRYARGAICAWAGGDADAIAAIGDNVVSEEIDVRSVMTKVQLGEADAGVVYASDAMAAEMTGTPLNVIEFPEDIPTAAAYPIAAVEGGNVVAAQAFISFVLSDEGQQILEDYGFIPAP